MREKAHSDLLHESGEVLALLYFTPIHVRDHPFFPSVLIAPIAIRTNISPRRRIALGLTVIVSMKKKNLIGQMLPNCYKNLLTVITSYSVVILPSDPVYLTLFSFWLSSGPSSSGTHASLNPPHVLFVLCRSENPYPRIANNIHLTGRKIGLYLRPVLHFGHYFSHHLVARIRRKVVFKLGWFVILDLEYGFTILALTLIFCVCLHVCVTICICYCVRCKINVI